MQCLNLKLCSDHVPFICLEPRLSPSQLLLTVYQGKVEESHNHELLVYIFTIP